MFYLTLSYNFGALPLQNCDRWQRSGMTVACTLQRSCLYCKYQQSFFCYFVFGIQTFTMLWETVITEFKAGLTASYLKVETTIKDFHGLLVCFFLLASFTSLRTHIYIPCVLFMPTPVWLAQSAKTVAWLGSLFDLQMKAVNNTFFLSQMKGCFFVFLPIKQPVPVSALRGFIVTSQKLMVAKARTT